MTEDVSSETFLDLAARSRVLDPVQLSRAAARLPGAPARQIADALVRSGDLTHFQAKKLLRGLWQGLALGPYHVLAPLGRGGMGTVYLARDTRLAEELGDEILVALKVLPPRVAREEERMLLRFRREIELGKRVNHPNVARTLTGGEADGVNFLAMEYVPGKTVRELVLHSGRMTVGEAARVFADVAAGLAHIHDRGLVHRDTKPGNVMVRPDGQAKLLDMGLAFAPGDPLPDDPRIVGGKGYIVGTMDFISPEQASDAAAARAQSDLYSLGCSVYYALTGTPPFPGGTSLDKIRRQRTLDPVPLSELNEDVPRAFARVVAQLMAKKPTDRPATALAARELLLPFAKPPAKAAGFSLRDVLGVVDTPDEHPELWTDDEPRPEPPPAPLSLDDDEPAARPPWLFAVGLVGALVVMSLLFTLLRRL